MILTENGLVCEGCGAKVLETFCECDFVPATSSTTEDHGINCECDECVESAREYAELGWFMERETTMPDWRF